MLLFHPFKWHHSQFHLWQLCVYFQILCPTPHSGPQPSLLYTSSEKTTRMFCLPNSSVIHLLLQLCGAYSGPSPMKKITLLPLPGSTAHYTTIAFTLTREIVNGLVAHTTCTILLYAEHITLTIISINYICCLLSVTCNKQLTLTDPFYMAI